MSHRSGIFKEYSSYGFVVFNLKKKDEKDLGNECGAVIRRLKGEMDAEGDCAEGQGQEGQVSAVPKQFQGQILSASPWGWLFFCVQGWNSHMEMWESPVGLCSRIPAVTPPSPSAYQVYFCHLYVNYVNNLNVCIFFLLGSKCNFISCSGI